MQRRTRTPSVRGSVRPSAGRREHKTRRPRQCCHVLLYRSTLQNMSLKACCWLTCWNDRGRVCPLSRRRPPWNPPAAARTQCLAGLLKGGWGSRHYWHRRRWWRHHHLRYPAGHASFDAVSENLSERLTLPVAVNLSRPRLARKRQAIVSSSAVPACTLRHGADLQANNALAQGACIPPHANSPTFRVLSYLQREVPEISDAACRLFCWRFCRLLHPSNSARLVRMRVCQQA